MKFPNKEKMNTTITIISFVVLVFLAWRVYSTELLSFCIDMPDYKIDQPKIEQVEQLLKPIIKNLPEKPDRINIYDKSGVASYHLYYFNTTPEQTRQLIDNITGQTQWLWLKEDESGVIYCYNQFYLVMKEGGQYGLSDDIKSYLYIAVGWNSFSDCRKQYYQSSG
ncbi:hypothetical protein SAMN02745664_11845 [Moraxella cuniculi DSM 21768]|uniref:Uncharacterized protein n=1 Tax=Moraxella cuniculi DSM 21768 TaxID=1122245 RepID=A0A1N7FX33_9GAMM|nr:hypothetical protein [Moraxella cuniculi]OOS03648.1 hypothetical protein B0189_09000 [Moraxella cuniculi]SIS04891.1 hypothetical protein SAMN02745664_11845 [Moraxella cuniculi DSM 21768]